MFLLFEQLLYLFRYIFLLISRTYYEAQGSPDPTWWKSRENLRAWSFFLQQRGSMQTGRSAPWKSVAVRDSTAGHRAERRSLRGSSEGRPGILSLLSSCGLAHDVALSRIFPVRSGVSFFFSSLSLPSLFYFLRELIELALIFYPFRPSSTTSICNIRVNEPEDVKLGG